MTGSLLGYFCYLGTAFAVVMAFLTSVLGDSTALSRASRHSSHVIVRKAAVNEVAARTWKKQEHLQVLGASEKEEPKAPSGNPDEPLVVTAARSYIEKNESVRLVRQWMFKAAARQPDNVTGAYPHRPDLDHSATRSRVNSPVASKGRSVPTATALQNSGAPYE